MRRHAEEPRTSRNVHIGLQETNERTEGSQRPPAALLELLIRELHLVPVELQPCWSEIPAGRRSDKRQA